MSSMVGGEPIHEHRKSEVGRRAKLHDRQRQGLRRRTNRVAARFCILFAADLLALASARLILGWAVARSQGGAMLAGDFRVAGPLAHPGQPASMVFWVAMIGALLATGAYSRHRGLNTPMRLAGASLLAMVAATVPLAAVIGLQQALVETGFVAVAAVAALIPVRLAAEFFLKSVWPRERGATAAMVIGYADARHSRVAAAVSAGGGDFKIIGHHTLDSNPVEVSGDISAVLARMIEVEDVEALVLTESLPDEILSGVVEKALSNQCLILCPPRALKIAGMRPRLVWHHDQPLLEFSSPALQLSALVTKRLTDIVGASTLLLLASPLMALIAITVRLDSPGPVFFSQDRAGVGGRRFRMLKFRTMRSGADQEKQQLAHLNHTGDARLFKIRNDPRVTRFGRFLRRWSLDELPQFWNVLRGDMSLVGPRPFFESDFAAYETHHFRRLDTKPGITGLWQVGGRSNIVDFEDVVYLDRQYIEQWSFWLDLSILLRTMPSVIRRTGAY